MVVHSTKAEIVLRTEQIVAHSDIPTFSQNTKKRPEDFSSGVTTQRVPHGTINFDLAIIPNFFILQRVFAQNSLILCKDLIKVSNFTYQVSYAETF